jgi:type IV secretion system protein TrbL
MATGRLQAGAYQLFFVLATLQFIITMYGELTKGGGEIESVISKLAKSVVWMSFCFWLMSDNHASNFIRNTVQYFIDNAIGFTTGTTTKMDVAGVVYSGIDGIKAVYNFAVVLGTGSTTGLSWTLLTGGSVNILEMGIAMFVSMGVLGVILLVTAYMAIKVLMLKIEALLITLLLPLNLALMGLTAMRDQGFAPFKHMVAIIFRILIMGVVIGGMSAIANNLTGYLNGATVDEITFVDKIILLFSLNMGYLMLGYLAYKADSIAASLASGSSNLGSQSDSAMAAALTAGLAAMAGGAVGAAAGKGASSVADMMKSSTIGNASNSGTGKTPSPPPPPPASASVGTGGSTGSGMPPQPSSSAKAGSAPAGPAAQSSDASAATTNSGGVDVSAAGTASDQSRSASTATSNGGGGESSSSGNTSAGSGADAGIAPPTASNGSGGKKDIKEPDAPPQDLASAIASALKENQKKSPMDSLKDRAGKTNDNIGRQDASTNVSINVHNNE